MDKVKSAAGTPEPQQAALCGCFPRLLPRFGARTRAKPAEHSSTPTASSANVPQPTVTAPIAKLPSTSTVEPAPPTPTRQSPNEAARVEEGASPSYAAAESPREATEPVSVITPINTSQPGAVVISSRPTPRASPTVDSLEMTPTDAEPAAQEAIADAQEAFEQLLYTVRVDTASADSSSATVPVSPSLPEDAPAVPCAGPAQIPSPPGPSPMSSASICPPAQESASPSGGPQPDIIDIWRGLTAHRLYVQDQPALKTALGKEPFAKVSLPRNDEDAMEELVRMMTRRDDLRRVVMDQIVAGYEPLRRAVFEQEREETFSSQALASLFEEPALCEGRASILAKLARTILIGGVDGSDRTLPTLHRKPIILFGEGGIGKSTIALSLLHRSNVEAVFGSRRFFVRCDGLGTLADLLGHLIRVLGISVPAGKSFLDAIIAFIDRGPLILVLDNFEDLCPDGPATGIETFLSQISNRAQLVVTKRGHPELRLPRMKSFEVRGLDDEATRAAFLAYADMAGYEDMPHDGDLDALLEELDGFPLALSLMARSLGPGYGCGEILEQYRAKRSALLELAGQPGRSASLAASVQLSLRSRVIKETEGATEACQLLALLPDGAALDLIQTAIIGDVSEHSRVQALGISRALTRAGLASRQQPSGFVRMVKPLREYFAGCDQCPSTHHRLASAVLDYMAQLGAASSSLLDLPAGEDIKALQRRIEAQTGNIEDAIHRGLTSSAVPHKLRTALELSGRFGEFLRITIWRVPRFLQIAVAAAETAGLERERALNLKALGGLLWCAEGPGKSEEHISQALDIFRSISDILNAAHCLLALSRMTYRTSQPDLSAHQSLEALALYKSVGIQLGEAHALQQLGTLALFLDQLERAKSHPTGSHELYQHHHCILGDAQCSLQLGRLALRQGHLRRSEEAIRRAMALFGRINSIRDLGHCQIALATGLMLRKQYDTAHKCLKEASSLFGAFASETHPKPDRLAGRVVSYQLDDFDPIGHDEGCLLSGRPHYISLKDARGYCTSLMGLGDISWILGRFEDAVELYNEALNDGYRRISTEQYQGPVLLRLSSIASKQGASRTAEEYMLRAMDWYHRRGYRRLGDAQRDIEQLDLSARDVDASSQRGIPQPSHRRRSIEEPGPHRKASWSHHPTYPPPALESLAATRGEDEDKIFRDWGG